MGDISGRWELQSSKLNEVPVSGWFRQAVDYDINGPVIYAGTPK
jgi:hypothetical protein